MQKDGYVFYRSVNGVWLTERVPVEYLEKVKTDERKDLSCTSAKKVQK